MITKRIDPDAYHAFNMFSVEASDPQIEFDGVYFEAQWSSELQRNISVSFFIFVDIENDVIAISMKEEGGLGDKGLPSCYNPVEFLSEHPGPFKLTVDRLRKAQTERAKYAISTMTRVSLENGKPDSRSKKKSSETRNSLRSLSWLWGA